MRISIIHKKIKTLFALVLTTLLVGNTAWAQPAFNTEPIKVIKAYEPNLADAVKVTPLPILPSDTLEKQQLDFTYFDKMVVSGLDVQPINPLRSGNETRSTLNNNFVKIGFGNYTTPLIDVNYMSLRNEKYQYGFKFNHFSSRGRIKAMDQEFRNVRIASNEFLAHGKYFVNQHTLSGALAFDGDYNTFYGFNSQDSALDINDLRQRFFKPSIKLGMASARPDADDLNYHFDFSFYNLQDKFEQSESDVRIETGIRKGVGIGIAQVNFDFDRTNYSFLDTTLNRNIYLVKPSYIFRQDRLAFDVGFILGGESGIPDTTKSKRTYFFPNVKVVYDLNDNNLLAFASLTGGILRNSLETMRTRNPFIGAFPDMRNTINRATLTAGLKGKIGTLYTFELSGALQQNDFTLFFLNDTLDFKRLKPVYDTSTTVFKAVASFGRMMGEKFQLNLHLQYQAFGLSNLAEPWMEPTFRTKLSGIYNIDKKLTLNADIFTFNGVDYLQPDGKAAKFKGIVDVNIGADYRYREKLSIFLMLNNIASANYFRWYNYPNFGFNVLAGVTFSL